MKKCNVLLVLDKSGSMGRTKNETIQGFNEYIQQFKEDSKDMDIRVSMVTFNGDVFEHYWDESANDLNELTLEDYRPSGSTAMWDGIGYGLRKIQNTTDINDENNSYLVIIISDGEENASTHVKQEEVKELISSYEKNPKWTFTFMGCKKEYLMKLSQEISIPTSNMAAWDNSTNKGTVQAMGFATRALRLKLADYKNDVYKSSNYYSMNDSIADFTETGDVNVPAAVDNVDIPVNVDRIIPNQPIKRDIPHNIPNQPIKRNHLRNWVDTSVKNTVDWGSYEKSWKVE